MIYEYNGDGRGKNTKIHRINTVLEIVYTAKYYHNNFKESIHPILSNIVTLLEIIAISMSLRDYVAIIWGSGGIAVIGAGQEVGPGNQ